MRLFLQGDAASAFRQRDSGRESGESTADDEMVLAGHNDLRQYDEIALAAVTILTRVILRRASLESR